MSLFIQCNEGAFQALSDGNSVSVHETTKARFQYVTDDPGSYVINIGDYYAGLHLNSERSSGSRLVYESATLDCFKNFVGICPISVSTEDGDDLDIKGSINIFASKATYERAISFLRFIVQHDDFSTACFSVARASSDADQSSNVSAKIEAGIKVLTHLQNEWERFQRDPCVKRSLTRQIERHTGNREIGPEAISHIAMHPDSLMRTEYGMGHLRFRGRHYAITESATDRMKTDANVQENFLLTQFLADFHRYLVSLHQQLSESSNQLKTLMVQDEEFMSIDQILSDSGLFLNFHATRINKAIGQALDLIQRFERDLGVKRQSILKVSAAPTQQVLVRPHYFQAYSLISDYLSTGEPSWNGSKDLYGLRNMPKLYEFVVLLSLIESIKAKRYELSETNYVQDHYGVSGQRPINEPNNHFVFKKGEARIDVFYEVKSKQIRLLELTDRLGVPVDIKHVSSRTWCPDFYIIHSEPSKPLRTHVLDAKYSSERTTLNFRLPECSFKYTTCMKALGVQNGQAVLRNVDSMILVHSEFNSRTKLINDAVRSHVPDFLSLDSLSPTVGIVGITEKHLEGKPDDLLSVLKIY